MKLLLTKKQLYIHNQNILQIKKKWNPQYESYILGIKNNYYILNTQIIVSNINKSLIFIRQNSLNKNTIYLFINKLYIKIFKEILINNNVYIQTRWIKGTLTNWINNKLNLVRKNRNIYINGYIKGKHTKLNILHKIPECIFLQTPFKNVAIIKEAYKLKIPIISFISVTDHYIQANLITYPIVLNNKSNYLLNTLYNLILNNIKLGELLKYKNIYKLYQILKNIK